MRSLHRLNRSKLKQTEAYVEQLRKPKPLGMGLQVPRGLDTQMPEKGFVWPAVRTYGGISRELARQKESREVEGHLMLDHIHMPISNP
jgi:hypothetical protein